MLLHSTVPKASSYRYSIKQHRHSPVATEMTAKIDLERNPGAPKERTLENPAEAKAEAPEKEEEPHPMKEEPKLYSSLSSQQAQFPLGFLQNTGLPTPVHS